MNKILVLVAGVSNLPFIKAAKELGLYVITCDINKNNPGHQFADERIYIDVYNYEQIIDKIKDLQIKYVFSFVSEHGLETAAIISEYFNLNGYSSSSISTLTNKGKFRDFLLKNNLMCPSFQCVGGLDELKFECVDYPVIIKPTDSGGSKGVKKIYSEYELRLFFNETLKLSKSKQVIVEQFIESDVLINGDCFIQNGKIIASIVGDYIYDRELTEVLPIATVSPSNHLVDRALEQVEIISEKLSIPNGIINFEAIILNNKAYIIEINPRPSGNYLWKLMGYKYSVDIPKLLLKVAVGLVVDPNNFFVANDYGYAYQLLYSSIKTTYSSFCFSNPISNMIKDIFVFKKEGDEVNTLCNLNDRVGIVLLEFKNSKERQLYLHEIELFKLMS